MKLIALVVLALFVAGTFGADLPDAIGNNATDLPIAKKPKTTTTKIPTTTVESTTTTSEAPKTTSSEAPKTTTTSEAPKTTSSEAPKTTTTSEAPKTTSTEAPKTTTPTPKPNDKPQKGTWKLFDQNTKEICIIVELATQLKFTYTTSDNKQNVTTYNIPVEETNTSQGHCTNGTTDETIIVTWPAKSQNKTNTFAYTFGLKDDKKTYYLKEAAYAIFVGDLYNGKNDTLNLIHNAPEYATPKGYSYHCTREKQLNLTDNLNKTIGSAHVSHVQLQSFYSSKTGEFTTAVDCESSGTPDYVPVAVGISLIALVVIVLIGYLVGRRRAQASGYVSM